jgi:hypothetical protein
LSYFDASKIVHDASPEELLELLIKYNQEASARIDPNGDTSFDILDENKRKRIPKDKVGYNFPHVAGFSITYQEGDRVQTPDGRTGTVLGSVWLEDLTLYRHNNEPRIGYFLVKIDFGDHTELHIRNDLRGSRLRYL